MDPNAVQYHNLKSVKETRIVHAPHNCCHRGKLIVPYGVQYAFSVNRLERQRAR